MTTPIGNHRISEVNFEEGFTGNGKVFIEVQKQADNSEKLVVYEANNALTAFFSNLFRIRSKTFTAREWAANLQGGTPEKIDKEKLVQNIKQAASKNWIESAPQILNKLVADKKLDAPDDDVKNCIRDIPLGKAACAIEIEASLRELQKRFLSGGNKSQSEIARELLHDLGLKLEFSNVLYLLTYLNFGVPDAKFGERPITQSLLSLQDTDNKKPRFRETELQDFLHLLIEIAPKPTSTNAPSAESRYLVTLNRIKENLQADTNASTTTKT